MPLLPKELERLTFKRLLSCMFLTLLKMTLMPAAAVGATGRLILMFGHIWILQNVKTKTCMCRGIRSPKFFLIK